jgi:hypothetical protein
MPSSKLRRASAWPSSVASKAWARRRFYRWRQKYGALTKSELARLKDLEYAAQEAGGRADAGQADPAGRAVRKG